MRRIAVINQKGGVGKTTTAANLGAALGKAGSRVLLVDLDPQAHLSLHFGVELADGQASVYDVLTSDTPIADVVQQVRENTKLVPADIDLAGAEAELVSITGREVLLREALEPVAGQHDYLLIDCPPSLGVLTVNALVAADEVLIPLQAHFLALQGLSKLLSTVTLVRQRINPNLRVGGIVLCLHESATRLAGEVVEDLMAFVGAARGTEVPWADVRVYETRIRRNIKLAESSSFGQTVFDYAPRSNGATDYARLAVEMFGRDAVMPGWRDGDNGPSGHISMAGRSRDIAKAVEGPHEPQEAPAPAASEPSHQPLPVPTPVVVGAAPPAAEAPVFTGASHPPHSDAVGSTADEPATPVTAAPADPAATTP